MADEARLNEILDLVEQARSEGDKDTEAKAVAAYKRESAPAAPFPDTYGGAGGYNPMLPRIAGAASAFAKPLGVTPENSASPIKNAFGPLESVAQAGSGLAGTIGGGLAGIGQGAWNLLTPKSMNGPEAADRVRQVQDAVTYQPRTASGAGLSRVAGAPQEAYSAGTNYLGEKATDITGSPLIGAAIKTGGDAVPMVFGGKGAAPEARAARVGESYAPKTAIPTKAELKSASSAAYKRSEDIGASVSDSRFGEFQKTIENDLGKQGIDATLHPDATAALKRVLSEKGPLTIEKAETLRRIAQDAESSIKPADARMSGQIVDHIDDFMDNLKQEDLVSGTPEAVKALQEARDYWKRARKADTLDELMRRAELSAPNFSASGMENAIRTEFRSLAKNERRFKRFSPEEQAAISRVAKGGPMDNALRMLGKFAPTGVVSTGISTGLGFALGGAAGAAALPAVGGAARFGASRMTLRNAELANELMRRGPLKQTAAPVKLQTAPTYESVPFTATGGVMPIKAAVSNGFELQPSGFLGSQQFPPAPSRLIADTPAAPQGGLPFTNTKLPNDVAAQLAGTLDFAKPQTKYPGGIDFTPPSMAPQMAGDIRLSGETPATPAMGQMESLDLPPPVLTPRPSKEILVDIRRLSAQMRKGLEKGDASSPEMQLALAQIRSLQLELEASRAGQ